MAGKKSSSKQPSGPAQPKPIDDDVEFPRGGANALTPLERRQIEEEAKHALDTEQAKGAAGDGPKSKNKRSHQKSKETDEDNAHFLGHLGDKSANAHVPLLTAKRLSVGMRLLAVVLEVHPHSLTLSLPHGLRANVKPEETSDVMAALMNPESKSGAALRATLGDDPVPSLPDLFHVGQYVRCEVTSTGQSGASGEEAAGGGEGKGGKRASRRVECTLRLSRVCAGRGLEVVRAGALLPAVVRGVEDHGYTLEFGIKHVKGFLPRSVHEAAHGQGASLSVGSLLDVVLQGGKDARGVVQVTNDPTAVAGTLASEGDALGLTSLLPGTLVNAKVAAVRKDGIVCKLLGVLQGTVDLLHLGPGLPSTKAFKQDQKLKARVLYIDSGAKDIALSLLPHVLALTLPSPVPLLGQVFESAPVLRVDEGLGLLLSLPMGGELGGSCPAFCHVTNVSDDKVPKLAAVFKAGSSKLKCRVIGFRLVDGLATVSATKAALEQQIMSMAEIQPGQFLSGKVVSTELDAGLLVEVAPHVTAIVPVLHMSDLGKEAARKKFKVGQVVQGRVLNVDPVARKLSLTLKPALLGSKLAPITSAVHLAPGTRSHGVVTGLTDYGVYVTFYGGVCGMAHVSELGLPKPGDKPASLFSIGQVVRARVLTVDSASGRVRLSLKTGTATAAPTTPTDPFHGLQPGQLVQGRVLKTEEAAGKAVLVLEVWSVEQGVVPEGEGAPARLELPGHIADHPGAAAALLPLLSKPGTVFGPLVVLERLEGQKVLRVSRKLSLVNAARAGRLVTSFDQVQEGSVVAGYVASVTADAVFVRLGGHVTGRAGLSQIADSFVSDPHTFFTEGQSVRAQVVTVDRDKQRFSVTLRPSLTASADASYLAALLSDLELAADLKASQSSGEEDAPVTSPSGHTLAPGGSVTGTVQENTDFGLTVDMDQHEDWIGLVRPRHYPPATASNKPGTRLNCRVLDVTRVEGIADLSARQDLVTAETASNGSETASKKAKKQKVAAAGSGAAPPLPEGARLGLSVEAVVELIRDAPSHVAVLSIPSLGHTLAFAALTDYNSAVAAAVKRKVELGATVQATLQVLPSPATGGRLLAAIDLTKAGPSKPKLSADAKPVKLTAGAVVSATVSGHPSGAYAEVVVNKKTQGRIYACDVEDLPDSKALQQAQQALEAAEVAGLLDAGGRPAKKQKKQKEGGVQPAAVPAELQAWVKGEVRLLRRLEDGQAVEAAVLPMAASGAKAGQVKHHGVVDLTLRPSLLSAAKAGQPLPAPVQFSSLQPKQLVVGVVTEVHDDHAWVTVSSGVRGRLHVYDSSVTGQPQLLSSFRSRFPEGRAVAAHVDHVDVTHHTLDLTLVPQGAGCDACDGGHVTSAAAAKAATQGAEAVEKLLAPGSWVLGKLLPAGGGDQGGSVRVHLGGKLHGQVALTDIHEEWVANVLSGLPAGGVFVRAVVLSVEKSTAGTGLPRVHLTLRKSQGGCVAGLPAVKRAAAASGAPSVVGSPCPATAPPVNLGQKVQGYVKKADGKRGVFVTLDRHTDARIKLSNLADGYVEDPVTSFPVGLLVEGRVVACEGSGSAAKIEISLKSSDAARTFKSATDYQEGDVVEGRVRRVETYGVFVELEDTAVVGLAHISELVDGGKVKDVGSLFKPQQTVTAKVLKVDPTTKKVSLSLKPSQTGVEHGQSNGQETAKKQSKGHDLDEEMADQEAAEKQKRSGNGRAAGSDDEDEEMEAAEDTDGSVDGGSDSDAEDDVGSDGEEGEGRKDASKVGIDDMDVDSEDGEEDEEGSDSDEGMGSDSEEGSEQEDSEEGSEREEEEEEGAAGAGAVQAGAALRQRLASAQAGPGAAAGGAGASVWGGLLVVEDEREKGPTLDEDRDKSKGAKASKAARKREAEEAERKIREAELARLQGANAPQSVVEFEQAVLASPSSSYTWIRYMAWLLGVGEVDKARAVAQRALDTINYREDSEKFNVWVAWLNLEASQCPPQDTSLDALMALFQRALQYCEPKKIYFALLGILSRGGHTDLEASTLKTMCKRFGGSAKVWVRAMESALSRGEAEGVRPVLQRALQALPQRKHIKVITSAALLEFRLGSAERGRSVMEGVLNNYPKRVDLWSVYVDQEVKLGDSQRTRALFERATSLPLAAKKVKFLFKRWLEWEKQLAGGQNTAAVEHVKQRAMEFVQQSAKA